MTTINRLWPDPDPRPLDDAGLLDVYQAAERMVRVNFISSADGAVTVDGKSGALGGAGDHRVFAMLRVVCDAVMVGAGTLRTEGYGPMTLDESHQRLRVDAGREPDPVLIVVSGGLDVDPDHPMFQQAPRRPYVLTHAASPVRQRDALSQVASVVICGETQVDFAAATAALAEDGVRQILCEGGPYLFGSLLAADVLDELCLTVAPKLTGPGAGRIVSGPHSRLREADLTHVLRSDEGELFLRYTRMRD